MGKRRAMVCTIIVMFMVAVILIFTFCISEGAFFVECGLLACWGFIHLVGDVYSEFSVSAAEDEMKYASKSKQTLLPARGGRHYEQ